MPDLIEVRDTVVSIDAIGCQREITLKIREKEAHYLLAVKENQPELHHNILQSFNQPCIDDSNTQMDTAHGRIEKRTCDVITTLSWIESKAAWKDVATLVRITSERAHKLSGKVSKQTRYYISSKQTDAITFNKLVLS